MKKLFSIFLSVAVMVVSLSTAGLTKVSAASDTITVAPENVLNVQVVDENGAPVNGVSMTLKDAWKFEVATWTSGNSEVTEENNSDIGDGTVFYEQWDVFEELVAPYDLKEIKVNGEDWYNTIPFNDAETKTIDMYYNNTSAATDLTVPAGSFVTYVDSAWSSKTYPWGVELEANDTSVYSGLLKDNIGLKTHSLVAGYYELWIRNQTGGGNTSGVTVSSVPTEYMKVRIKLSEISEKFNDDGTGSHDGQIFSFSTDTTDKTAALIFTSGAVVSAAIPDAQGYVDIYVEKSTREFRWGSEIISGTSHMGGTFNGGDKAYDKKSVTAQAIDLPNTGTNLLYVPAGDYSVEFTNVPAGYKSGAKAVTVTQSQNVQTLQIVLEKEHVHEADTSQWINDEDEHWHNCTGCEETLDNVAHTAGAAATEDAAQTCTICGYEIAPKLEHVHNYADEYVSDNDNHWKECACGSKSDEQAHEFTWITDKAATATEAGSKHEECTVCMYKKVAIEIPALGNQEPETNAQPKPEPETQPNSQPEESRAAALQTGDNTLSILWISLLLVSIGAYVAIYTASCKKENEK